MVMVLVAPTGADAQEDCGNGKTCPKGYACVKGGVCGPLMEAAPGSVRLPDGSWCEPGFRKHAYVNKCSPNDYTDCSDGMVCPRGATCRPGGGCDGVRLTGPMCGNSQCSEGRICSSAGCINPTYFKDCGGGTICTHASACAEPSGCAIVGPQRIPQQPARR
jgi:hypothetical protein